jgi:hypothetical protein
MKCEKSQRENKQYLHDRGYAPNREQATADFKAAWGQAA